MDIEKLIERLKHDANAYRNGDTLGRAYADQEDVLDDAAASLSALQAENEKLRTELERMKKIMRDNGIMTIPPKYPGGPTEWNIPKPRGQKED